jgi:DNA-binding MarR family transcriptional regulator
MPPRRHSKGGPRRHSKGGPRRQEGPRRPPEEAAAALARVAPLVSRWMERSLAELERPLTVAQYLLLEAIERGSESGAELARQAGVSAPAVSQLVAALEGAGLVERTEEAGPDRRRRPLRLTRAGKSALRSAQDRVRRRLAEVLEGLPGSESRGLERSLAEVEALLLGTAPPRRPHPPKPPHRR